jgi:putative phosphoesterase
MVSGAATISSGSAQMRRIVSASITPRTIAAVLIAIISDTHLPRGTRRLPEECVERIRAADLLVHAGDISTPEVLAEIEELGPPVAAVHGNVDSPELRRTLPEARLIDAGGARLAVVHDAGPRNRRLERMRARFPDADAVVFGHSHIPLHEEREGFQIFNPGSPTDRRRQPRHTMGIARTRRGRLVFEHVVLD